MKKRLLIGYFPSCIGSRFFFAAACLLQEPSRYLNLKPDAQRRDSESNNITESEKIQPMPMQCALLGRDSLKRFWKSVSRFCMAPITRVNLSLQKTVVMPLALMVE